GPTKAPPSPEELRRRRLTVTGAVVVGALALAAGGWLVYWLLQPETPTATIRDILMIGMALELLVLGVAAIVLIVQIARLVNLVNNEVKPVLESANETMNTLRGTATFLGDNLVKPVFKANTYIAAIRRVLNLLNLGK
ncbi:MAG: hypothetical protein OEZ02_15855, partial [Anaerolineae bacterium]|nr:hypothetical protein [Anaerolineae bacterium]